MPCGFDSRPRYFMNCQCSFVRLVQCPACAIFLPIKVDRLRKVAKLEIAYPIKCNCDKLIMLVVPVSFNG